MGDRLTEFLRLVRVARWRGAPHNWSIELRQALNDDLVSVGFGGLLKLTDKGEALASGQGHPKEDGA
jgi:hypothetical protein